LTYKPYGSRAILVEWPSKIDKNILRDVILFKNKILRDRGEVILEVINTYK
jgi:inhibitor of KinA